MSGARVADRARIADIEAEIQKLESSIRAYRSEQELIRARLDSYKYPILTLPNEIVSEIFIHFLPVYPLCPPLSGIYSPTVLTHICRKWREIALATPALWRAIAVDLILYDRVSEAQVDVVESWLRRSGCCPLSIRMDDQIYRNGIRVDKILKTILARRSRWEHIKLVFDLSYLLDLGGSMPLLRELEIQIHDDDVPSVRVELQEVPRLRAVTLWDFPYPTGFLPWSQLTSLTLVAKEPHECTLVLAQTVNLVYFKLVIYAEYEQFDLPDIRLPFLESLIFVQFDVEDVPPTRYLGTFIVPALRQLQVPESFIRGDSLLRFVSKSGCQLREVYITGKKTIPEEVWNQDFPTLTFLFNEDLIDWYSMGAQDDMFGTLKGI